MIELRLKSLWVTLEHVEDRVLGYVYLQQIAPGQVEETVEVESLSVMVDYDVDGKLLGVEFLAAEEADEDFVLSVAKKLNAPILAGIDLAEACKNFF